MLPSSAYLKVAIVFGIGSLFGISDFVSAYARDALNSTRIVSFTAAIATGIAALVLLWERHRDRAP
jgi:drug/metabolite transporter (DMT)-like permease